MFRFLPYALAFEASVRIAGYQAEAKVPMLFEFKTADREIYAAKRDCSFRLEVANVGTSSSASLASCEILELPGFPPFSCRSSDGEMVLTLRGCLSPRIVYSFGAFVQLGPPGQATFDVIAVVEETSVGIVESWTVSTKHRIYAAKSGLTEIGFESFRFDGERSIRLQVFLRGSGSGFATPYGYGDTLRLYAMPLGTWQLADEGNCGVRFRNGNLTGRPYCAFERTGSAVNTVAITLRGSLADLRYEFSILVQAPLVGASRR